MVSAENLRGVNIGRGSWYRYGISLEALKEIRAWNARCIRGQFFLTDYKANFSELVKAIKYLVLLAKQAGLYVVISPSGEGWFDPFEVHLQAGVDLPTLWDTLLSSMGEVARDSQFIPEIINEPRVKGPESSPPVTEDEAMKSWSNIAQACIDTIRKHTNNTIIVPELIIYRYIKNVFRYMQYYPLTDPNKDLIFSQHVYDSRDNPLTSEQQTREKIYSTYKLDTWSWLKLNTPYSIVMGELGVRWIEDSTWYKNFLDIIWHDFNAGCIAWGWYTGIPETDYMTSYTNRDNPSLLRSNHVNPIPSPSGTIFREYLKTTPMPSLMALAWLTSGLSPVITVGSVVAVQELKKIGIIP